MSAAAAYRIHQRNTVQMDRKILNAFIVNGAIEPTAGAGCSPWRIAATDPKETSLLGSRCHSIFLLLSRNVLAG